MQCRRCWGRQDQFSLHFCLLQANNNIVTRKTMKVAGNLAGRWHYSATLHMLMDCTTGATALFYSPKDSDEIHLRNTDNPSFVKIIPMLLHVSVDRLSKFTHQNFNGSLGNLSWYSQSLEERGFLWSQTSVTFGHKHINRCNGSSFCWSCYPVGQDEVTDSDKIHLGEHKANIAFDVRKKSAKQI